MIPVKLELKNFLCYGEGNEPLDFSGFRIVCISGNNGNGKSALLDAITWAIWGEARKGTRGKEELIRIGAREMMVSFEFEVEGELYRVVRSYTRGKGGALQFFALDRKTGSYRNLTGPSIRDTENGIRKVMGMDFDTFLSSAFIAQGRSDEFTRRKSPRERKEILARILGLSKYDALSSLAREKVNSLDKDIGVLISRKELMEQRLGRREELRERIATMEGSLSEISGKGEELLKKLDMARRKRDKLISSVEEHRTLRRRKEELEEERMELEKELESKKARLKELESILSRSDEVQKAYAEYLDLVEMEKEETEKLLQVKKLESERKDRERDLERKREELLRRKALLEKDIEDRRKRMSDSRKVLERKGEVENGLSLLHELREKEKEMEEKRKLYEDLQIKAREIEAAIRNEEAIRRERIKGLEAQIRRLEEKAKRMEDLKGQKERILEELRRLKELEERGMALEVEMKDLEEMLSSERAAARDLEERLEEKEKVMEIFLRSTEPHCPLCASFLDEERRERVKERLASERDEMKRRLGEVRGRISELESRAGRMREEISRLRSERGLERGLLEKVARLDAEISEAKEAAEEASLLRCELEVMKDILESGDFSKGMGEELREIYKRIEELEYDPNLHEDLRGRIRALSRFETEWERIRMAEETLREMEEDMPEREKELSELSRIIETEDYGHEERRMISEIESAISSIGYDEEEHKRIKAMISSLSGVKEERERLERARGELDPVRRGVEDLEGRIADVKHQISSLSSRIEELSPSHDELLEVEREIEELEGELESIRDLEKKLYGELSIARSEMEELDRVMKEAEEIGKRLEEAYKERRIYESLVKAFGKDGIQALIMENVIPEIEEEANRMISILTSGAVSIAIEPLRDLKSGGIKETLDILISDEVGTRSYELYSGGEAFRIDFALRVAISRVLARRSGVRLRTLIIDEGFGSQDLQGQEQFVEAINAIGEEFDKIIVVTHLEELKNKFPARIEVYKHPYLGSRYEVIT